MRFIIPNIKKSIQRDDYSCGVHSVKSITNYYDRHYSLQYIKKLLKTNKEHGTNQTAIENFFKKVGIAYKINTHASVADIENEINKLRPVLVALEDCEHWVVIIGYSENCFYILDSGSYIVNKRIYKKTFRRYWDEWIMSIKRSV